MDSLKKFKGYGNVEEEIRSNIDWGLIKYFMQLSKI
jgi:hypothetical protein